MLHYFSSTLGTRAFSLLLFLSIAACGSSMDASRNEFVMCPGASLVVDRGGDSFEIDAESPLIRAVRMAGHTQEVHLEPRLERWNGSLGLMTAHGGFTGPYIVAEEGRQYFDSTNELLYWLNERSGQKPSSIRRMASW